MLRLHLLLVDFFLRRLSGKGDAPPGVVLDTEESPPTSAAAEAERGKKEGRKPAASSVLAGGVVRRVRAWLEPYVTLLRYWRAFSDGDPPEELQKLLEWVFAGEGLCLFYVR